jgi:hypothetical protein
MQVQPYTPAGKVASGAGGKSAPQDKSLDRYFVIVEARERRPARSMSKVQAACAGLNGLRGGLRA